METNDQIPKPSGVGSSVLLGRERFTCDCCEESWELGFRCGKCSRIATDERIGDDEWGGFAMDVCGNCCQCHLRESATLAIQMRENKAPEDADENDVPF